MCCACLIVTGPASAREVSLGVSFSIPPFVMEDGASGVQVDIVREALAYNGHTLKVRMLSQARTFNEFTEGTLDAVLNVKPDTFPGVAVSEPVVVFQNYAIRLGELTPAARPGLQELADARTVAFQNARRMLGVEFAKAVADNPMYHEIAKQKLQVKLLFAGRVDYAILEGRIFNFYLQELREENIGIDPETTAGRVNYETEVTFLPMFPAAPYRVGFLDSALRDDFDEGLQALRESGRYTEIFEQYNATHPAP